MPQYRTQQQIQDQMVSDYTSIMGYPPISFSNNLIYFLAYTAYTYIEQPAELFQGASDIYNTSGIRTDEVASYAGVRRQFGKQTLFNTYSVIDGNVEEDVVVPALSQWSITDVNGIEYIVLNQSEINIPNGVTPISLYDFQFFYTNDKISLDLTVLLDQPVIPIDSVIADLLTSNKISYFFSNVVNNGFSIESDDSVQVRVLQRNNMLTRVDRYMEEVLRNNYIRYIKVFQNRNLATGLSIPPFSDLLPVNNCLVIVDKYEDISLLTNISSSMGYIFYSIFGEGTTWTPSDSGYIANAFEYDVVYNEDVKWTFKYMIANRVPLKFQIKFIAGSFSASDQIKIVKILSDYNWEIQQTITQQDFINLLTSNGYSQFIEHVTFNLKSDSSGDYLELYQGGILDIFYIEQFSDVTFING